MGKVSWRNEWVTQIGVAVGYALLYLVTNPLSTSHWPLHAGLRLACLLLFPTRFWLALFFGEAISNGYEISSCLDTLGPAWVAARSIPPILPIMPVVWWFKTKMPPFPAKHLVDIKALILCILLSSVAGMVYSTSAYPLLADKFRPSLPISLAAIGFFLGPYLAILSVVPWAVMAKLDYRPGHLREMGRQLVTSKLFLDTVALLLPALVILSWLGAVGKDEQVKQVASVAMFLPMAWLTLKHGWRAAAISSTLAIVIFSLSISMAGDFDTSTYATQVCLAIGATSLFALGARISAQLILEQKERLSAANVQRLARQTMQAGELRMRQTSQALEYLAGTLHVTNSRLLEQMRRVVPNIESHAFYKQAVATQAQVYSLAESMHPVAWRERGLPAALNETVARALDEAGIAYRCEITGRGYTRLAPSVLTATYRVVCEAIVYVTSRLACNRVRLVLRGGETHGRRWVVLRVEGVLEDTGVANAVFYTGERQRLATKLGASMQDLPEMRDHVSVFDGVLHMRTPNGRLRLTALLHDVPQEAQKPVSTSAPLRLWVK
jgi:two-component system, NarL family, sensor histidine kinase FusK